jgi:hypothetical protein
MHDGSSLARRSRVGAVTARRPIAWPARAEQKKLEAALHPLPQQSFLHLVNLLASWVVCFSARQRLFALRHAAKSTRLCSSVGG